MSWYKKAFVKLAGAGAQDVYDAYILNELVTNYRSNEEVMKVASFLANVIKNNFVRAVQEVMYQQIQKYLAESESRQRIAPGTRAWLSKATPSTSISELAMMMMGTQRSSSHQKETGEIRNVNWERVGRAALNLSKEQEVGKVLMGLIGTGGLFNCIHNSGAPLLSKFPNGGAILQAFNEVHTAKDPKMFVGKASSDVKDLMETVGLSV